MQRLLTAAFVWWLVLVNAQGAVIRDRVEGPYPTEHACLDEASWMNNGGPNVDGPPGSTFACRSEQ
jgi:hypothetical protein